MTNERSHVNRNNVRIFGRGIGRVTPCEYTSLFAGRPRLQEGGRACTRSCSSSSSSISSRCSASALLRPPGNVPGRLSPRGKKLPGWALALSERSTGSPLGACSGSPASPSPRPLRRVDRRRLRRRHHASWIWLAREFRRERDRYGVLTLPTTSRRSTRSAGRSSAGSPASSCCSSSSSTSRAVQRQRQDAGGHLRLDPTWGIVLSALVVIAYAMAGGFLSVVWTDVVQAVLMILSLGVLPVIALFTALSGARRSGGARRGRRGRDSWTGG